MKKILMAFSIAALSFGAANAQSGKNQISIGADLGLPMGDFGDAFKLGFGGSAKYLHGVGSAGQISLTAGYATFSAKNGVDAKTSFIPVFVGYRHNFSGAYVEPQVGFTSQSAKVMGMSGSTSGFGYAIAAGYAMESGLDLSARYQAFSKDGTAAFIGFRVAYNFSLGGN